MRLQSLWLLVLCICMNQMVAAQPGVDTSYRTTYYEQKVTMFRLQPDSKDEIIFLGDSITDIAEWAEIWRNRKVRNRGISSDNTFGVLARLDEVLSGKPRKIFIMIGINDIARNTPDTVIVANYKKMLERIKQTSPATKVYVQSVLPTNSGFTEFIRHQNKDEHIRYVNQALQNLATSTGCTYVDLYSSFLDATGKLDNRYTNDGLHINGYGYALWKQILEAKGYMK
ncbi:GDSL-type esterase/lipase family protein [Flavisolibacter tropicus]|uniref:Sialate O-acetylesterase n=1 Tax=Flavisolibacter tropicus TaxID=1492898 RepID=A0A172TSC6_9BACT|nr:GDSL-type esterase/lipase family protein [Flavisolibacter tropicus]ANE49989.1 sialate O-acetylesterase [Flavisolibacter tropicus]